MTIGEVADVVTNVAIGIEVLIAVYLVIRNREEVRILREQVRPRLREGEELPLLDALIDRGIGVTRIAIYLLAVTALAAFGVQLAMEFPPIRAFNAALLLYLIAGPRIYGNALRQRVASPPRSEEDAA